MREFSCSTSGLIRLRALDVDGELEFVEAHREESRERSG